MKIYCRPDIYNLQINEFCAKWNLQSIIDHNNKRAIESVEFILLDDQKNLTCIYKHSFDGASGQKWYHQKSESEENIPDKDLFENKSPNSSKFCQPILIISMFNETTNEINNLQDTIIYNFTCSF